MAHAHESHTHALRDAREIGDGNADHAIHVSYAVGHQHPRQIMRRISDLPIIGSLPFGIRTHARDHRFICMFFCHRNLHSYRRRHDCRYVKMGVRQQKNMFVCGLISTFSA